MRDLSQAIDDVATELAREELRDSMLEIASLLEESLKHPKHADALAPQQAKFQRILKRRWRSQRAMLVIKLDAFLHQETSHVAEVDAELRARLQAAVTARLNATAVFDGNTHESDDAAYAGIVSDVMAAATERMTLDYMIQVAAETGQRAMVQYLQDRAFSKLAADIDLTTKEMIRDALVNTFETGGSYQDAVKAIGDTMDGMATWRAESIAKTELNAAYNSAMLESAREVSGTMKRWEPDGEACEEICVPNVEQGEIGIGESFDSGDDAPPAHTNCDCSLSFIFPSGAEE